MPASRKIENKKDEKQETQLHHYLIHPHGIDQKLRGNLQELKSNWWPSGQHYGVCRANLQSTINESKDMKQKDFEIAVGDVCNNCAQ